MLKPLFYSDLAKVKKWFLKLSSKQGSLKKQTVLAHIFWKALFLENCLLSGTTKTQNDNRVCKIAWNHYEIRLQTNLAQIITPTWPYLAQIITPDLPRLPWDEIEIHIYSTYAVESELGPKVASKLGPSFLLFFLFFVLFKNHLLCAGRMKFFKESQERRRQKWPVFWVKTWCSCVAQHTWTKFWRNLGPSFDSTFLTFLALFSFFRMCWNHYFYSVFSNNLHF